MEAEVARPSIAIVVAFFGRAPFWLPAFLRSCRDNRDVQWLVYTDCDVTGTIPGNVMLKHMEVSDLARRAAEVFRTPVEIQSSSAKAKRVSRKACDLKPGYGLIFEDDLRPFEFWACSDLDIIWGDIRRFVTDGILTQHDVISSRADRLSGHFTLYRNTPAINRTFELIPDLATAMANPQYLHLDEQELTNHLRARIRTAPAQSAPRVYWREDWTMSAEYQRGLLDGSAHTLWWRNGKTFDAEGRELMYLHFHKMKKEMHAIDFGFDDAPAAFAITRDGFSAVA
jgi:hypothetical protein